VNDVAVAGGRPLWLSLALILEEGLPIDVLRRALDSVKRAAAECGVAVVTGDTKVVPRGLCDGMYMNTAGIGEAAPEFRLGTERIRPGDKIVASGDLGDHGMAVMTAREGIGIQGGPTSDTGPVHRMTLSLRPLGEAVRFMRDPTRGGAAAVLGEIVRGRPFGLFLRERDLPFSARARAVAEMLGLDLMHSASEGRVLAVCDAGAADAVVAAWRAFPEGRGACVIGEATDEAGRVVMETAIGGRRLVDVPRGELLPRIC
jgi:hydrogenase expression/formation protein HypE